MSPKNVLLRLVLVLVVLVTFVSACKANDIPRDVAQIVKKFPQYKTSESDLPDYLKATIEVGFTYMLYSPQFGKAFFEIQDTSTANKLAYTVVFSRTDVKSEKEGEHLTGYLEDSSGEKITIAKFSDLVTWTGKTLLAEILIPEDSVLVDAMLIFESSEYWIIPGAIQGEDKWSTEIQEGEYLAVLSHPGSPEPGEQKFHRGEKIIFYGYNFEVDFDTHDGEVIFIILRSSPPPKPTPTPPTPFFENGVVTG